MIAVTNLRLSLDEGESLLIQKAAQRLGVRPGDIQRLRIVRMSLDARDKRDIHFTCTVEAGLEDEAAVSKRTGLPIIQPHSRETITYGHEELRGRPVVAGAGPAGLFAALTLAQHGYRPLILERGKQIEERKKDADAFWGKGIFDPESNAAFGEGGAGAFSDGKLTTRIKDERREDVLQALIECGAPESIDYDAKPHLGTDVLYKLLPRLRNRIIEMGGEFLFSTKLESIIKSSSGALKSIQTGGKCITIETNALVLAIGSGARDTYSMLFNAGAAMEAKPFAIGLRIEHPQEMINLSQYGAMASHPRLGAAEYHLAGEQRGRGVYTFCMCPGGEVMGSTSESGCLVVNGMSNSARSGLHANSAVVAQVSAADFGEGILSGVEFQRQWEKAAFSLGGGGYIAPAQTAEDFLAGKTTVKFDGIQPTYRPGVTGSDLSKCLPEAVTVALKEGIKSFGRMLKGFDMPGAVLTAIETRTSSPIRILRDKDCESLNLPGLYPCGEGAGYAGGIVSAAVDGIRVAEAVIRKYKRPVG